VLWSSSALVLNLEECIKLYNVLYLCRGLCDDKVLVLSAVASDVCNLGIANLAASDVH
jgi:hypothetical protein